MTRYTGSLVRLVGMFSSTSLPTRCALVLAAIVGFAACGGSSNDTADGVPPTTVVDAAATSAAASGATSDETAPPTTGGIVRLDPGAGGQGGAPDGDGDRFADLTACLNEQGLDVTAPAFGPGDGLPPGGTIPDGLPPGGTLPDGLPPGVGSIPDGSLPPPGDFDGGGGGRGPGGFDGDPTAFIAQLYGLDTTDATVTAALDACSDPTQFPGGGAPPDGAAPPTTASA